MYRDGVQPIVHQSGDVRKFSKRRAVEMLRSQGVSKLCRYAYCLVRCKDVCTLAQVTHIQFIVSVAPSNTNGRQFVLNEKSSGIRLCVVLIQGWERVAA